MIKDGLSIAGRFTQGTLLIGAQPRVFVARQSADREIPARAFVRALIHTYYYARSGAHWSGAFIHWGSPYALYATRSTFRSTQARPANSQKRHRERSEAIHCLWTIIHPWLPTSLRDKRMLAPGGFAGSCKCRGISNYLAVPTTGLFARAVCPRATRPGPVRSLRSRF